MPIKSIRLKQGSTASSNNSVLDPSFYLNVDHEEAHDVPFNDVGSLTAGSRSGVSTTRDPYSGKLIAEWMPDLNM
jgi:hypothetical protein